MAFRSSSQTLRAAGVGTALTGSAPAGLVAGDYLAGFVVLDGITSDTITPPSGWTSRGSFGFAAGVPDGSRVEIFDKIATGSDSFAWTTSVNNAAILVVGAWSGRNGSFPRTFVGAPAPNTTANATPVSIALSSGTAASGDDIAFFGMLDLTVGTDTWGYSPPGGYTERNDAQQAFASATLATLDNVSAGAVGTLTATGTRSAGTGAAGFGGFVIGIASAGMMDTSQHTRGVSVPLDHEDDELELTNPSFAWYDWELSANKWYDSWMPEASGGTTFPQTVGGSLSFVGTLQKQTNKQLVGALSFVGTLQKRTSKTFSGGLTFNGTLAAATVFLKSNTGSLSFTGTLQKQTNKVVTGSLSFAGTLQRQTNKQLVGVLNFVGALARSQIVQKLVTGVLSFAGSLATMFTPGGGGGAKFLIKKRARRDRRSPP